MHRAVSVTVELFVKTSRVEVYPRRCCCIQRS